MFIMSFTIYNNILRQIMHRLTDLKTKHVWQPSYCPDIVHNFQMIYVLRELRLLNGNFSSKHQNGKNG